AGEIPGQPQDHSGQHHTHHHGERRDQAWIAVVPGELVPQALDGAEGGGQVDEGGHGGQGRADEGGDVEAAVDGRKAGLAAAHPGDEDAQHGYQGSDGGDDQREHQSGLTHGGLAQDEGGHEGDGIGLEQVGGHAGAVAHVVAHVVGAGGGVARVVLAAALFDL